MKKVFLFFMFLGLPIAVGVIIYNAIFKASNQASPVATTSSTVGNSVSTTVQSQSNTATAVKSSRVS